MVAARCLRGVKVLVVGSSLLAIAGCVAQRDATTPEVTPGDGLLAANQGPAEAFPDGSSTLVAVAGTVLVDPSQGDIGLEVINGSDFSNLVIRTTEKDPVFKISQLRSPARLVLDMVAPRARLNRVLDIPGSTVASRVRIGAHPDKSRLVFDLADGETINNRVETTDGVVVIQIFKGKEAPAESVALLNNVLYGKASPQFGENSSATVAETKLEEAAPQEATTTPEVSIESQPTDETVAASAVAVDSNPGETTTRETKDSTAQNTQPEKNQVAMLNSIAIQGAGSDENILVAEVSGAATHKLKRTTQGEYVLTIANAGIASEIPGSLIAPPRSGAIRSVRPVASTDGASLRIFADPKIELIARSEYGKIIVESLNLSRAQMDPSTAVPAAEASNSAAPAAAAKSSANGNGAAANATDANISAFLEETPRYTGRLISLDLQDTDIDNALRIIAEVSNLNIIASDDVTGKVTLRLMDVPWDQALDVILKTNGLDKVQDMNVIRIAPVEKLQKERTALKQAQQAAEELEPLRVRYIRINYARSSELSPLVQTVVSERGSVAYDERSNQIIVKDIQKGILNVAELVSKLDLRTPQVLLETQIVEAQRNLLRSLGAELGFNFVASPATGNALGYNFPNSVSIGGAVPGTQGIASAFPVAGITASGGSAVSALFGSADGTKSLSATISSLENEGRVRLVSRPSVATLNNKQAQIKAVEKIRIRLPAGGTSVATGQGANANSGNTAATEIVEIGITLDVTPQASPDYYVLLDINAKSSSLGSREVDSIPSEIERSATSTVLVSSGQTFALGGIYKITDRDAISGVPFLKDIPFLGHLFRTVSVNNSDEELIFFITPRVVEGSFDDAAMKSVS